MTDVEFLGIGGIEWSTAFGTKHLRATIPALCRLHVTFRLAFQDEAFNRCTDHGAKRGPGQHLAIRTVAHHDAGRIDIGREGNGAAMTGTVDAHDGPRDAPLRGCHGVEWECSWCCFESSAAYPRRRRYSAL